MNPFEPFRRDLAELGAALGRADEPTLAQVLETLEKLEAWAEEITVRFAAPKGKEWASQVRSLENGIRSGRPLDQAVERTLELFLEISQGFDRVSEGREEPVPAAEMPPKPAAVSPGGVFFIQPDDMPSFKDFTLEVPEYLQTIESNLLSLSRGEDWDALKVYRPFHTLKGICGFVNLPSFSKLAHTAEALLEPYKNGQNRPSSGQIDLLLKINDAFKSQLEKIQEGMKAERFVVEDVTALLGEYSAWDPGLQSATPGAAPHPVPGPAGTSPVEGSGAHKRDNTLRIGIEKMDALLEAVGELVICQSQVSEGLSAVDLSDSLAAETNRLGKISLQLQHLVLSLRMVPVQPLLHRMNRLAHDLSKKTGKPLRVEITGDETELDKGIVEELSEPLSHLLRNAVDHGLEPEAKRREAGKNPEGKLTLAASHESGDFVLRVGDDGAGLDLAGLEQKGRALGLIPPEQQWDRDRIIELIFTPGFSTAREISEVSGRGVGLDVVRRKIESLHGAVEVESHPGLGTVFTLRAPLAVALMEGIWVRVGEERYVLPAYSVRQFIEYSLAEPHRVGAGPLWIRFRDEHIPMVDLGYWLGKGPDLKGRPILLHLDSNGKQAGLLVDEVLGKRQVVVKHLGETLKDARGVSGAAILGDGRVGLILDVDAFLKERQSAAAVR
jgi:two-component system chemotaxis sensor kinase CheA